MGKYSNSSRSFNTLKHSNRAERSKRKVQSKYLILSICAVVIAILLSLMVFLVMAIAHKENNLPVKQETNDEIALNTATLPAADVSKGNLQLVNKLHKYQFLEGSSLVPASGVTTAGCVKDGSILVNSEALAAFDSMMKKYLEVFGDCDVWLTEAYRTEADQAGKEFPAGYSDHHTGRLLTITKKGTSTLPSDNWIYQNCYKYGFVVRYPDAKSASTGANPGYTYAFRYVGVPHATYMQKNNLCLEEYVILLQNQYASGDFLKFSTDDGTRYAVYSVRAASSGNTTLSLPTSLPYTVSGDNAGNFIITVNLGKAE